MLPYVVERKRLDDLASSIRDSRYREQKFRLRRCGLPHVIYLAEALGTGPRAHSVRWGHTGSDVIRAAGGRKFPVDAAIFTCLIGILSANLLKKIVSWPSQARSPGQVR